ncbi:MAG: CoA transferase [Brevundimonas sp.]|uniref:CaiB/BaiF CoA transferase family protein n=1 Tax=Brevundimonas sp. TaxID=1871086 RepID=UPI0025BDD50F|nr:CoA transferase [Brevundimonas sp.]MCH4269685.1 CoA transferase [Brevundimonas sp.]
MTDLSYGPLSGIRVVDLTTVIMGPYATQLLGDMGADVIKVEPPQGDSARSYKPQRIEKLSGIFLSTNRNKRSIALDLKRPAARRALARLVSTADVFVHNLRPTVIERSGFDYASVLKLNPDIIYCTATGFGAEGPYAEKPAYDDMIQAASGMASMFELARGAPAYVPQAICDKLGGQMIATAILGAVVHRERGGGGQSVEVPMFETAIAYNMIENFGPATFTPRLGGTGFTRLQTAERRPYQTLDGHVCILPYSDKNWQDFFRFVERDDFLNDRRFMTLAERAQNFPELYAMVALEAAKHTTSEWLEFCERADIPCMPVVSLDEIESDPHVRAVGLFQSVEHPESGPYRIVRSPIRYGAAPFALRRHAPTLGQHNEEVLRAVGLSTAEIDDALGRSAA